MCHKITNTMIYRSILLLSIFLIIIQVNLSYTFNKIHPRNTRCYSNSKVLTDKPKWAAGGFVSDFVNALISIKPLFGLMKLAARQTLINTAEKNGVPWRERAYELEQKRPDLELFASQVTRSEIQYPLYYTKEFHAYDEGNLNWPAAYECEQATMSMALRVWPKEKISPTMAQDRLRYSFIDAVKEYYTTSANVVQSSNTITKENTDNKNNNDSNMFTSFVNLLTPKTKLSVKKKDKAIKNILDVGCSVGVSTFYIADSFPEATVTGLDLSPQFLSVALERQKNYNGEQFPKKIIENIRFVHDKAEDTKFPLASFELLTICFMFHELPQAASNEILSEMFRICTPGGVIAITDNNPKSPVIQNLPPALFTLMKSTEPWTDEYYIYDVESALRQTGFVDVKTVDTDPRHRTILARKPSSSTAY